MKMFGTLLGIWVLLLFGLYLLDPNSHISSASTVVSSPPAKPVVVRYRAVLAAGSDVIPNFDNATSVLAERLKRSDEEVTVLTSADWLVRGDTGPWYAAAWTIDEALKGLRPGEGCLVFVTSHGNEDGLEMDMDNAEHYQLRPARLAQILTQDCGDRPTVAILSGCHTGTFLTPEMVGNNRIILTAARKDRTSFGCSADTTYTYFDECLLDQLGDAGTWAAIFDRTKACVEEKERAINARPSLPQAYFGEKVRDLGIE